MVIGLNSGEAKMADRNKLLKNLAVFRKTFRNRPNAILADKIRKLETELKIPSSLAGDTKFAPKAPEKEKPKKADPIGSLKVKDKDEDEDKVEADDWWGEDEDPDWWKAKPKAATTKAAFGRSPGALGGRLDLSQGYKHGGRIKKPKKKTKKRKRAALRGYRAELRGG